MRSMFALAALAASTLVHAQSMTNDKPIVIRADRILDGRGKVITGGSVVVQGGKITRVNAESTGPVTYDLKGFTLMPGLIDAHSHLTWYFNRQGRYHQRGDGDTEVESMLSTAANAYATLMAGFTTIQSPGSPEDKDLRDWIENGGIPGPRVLTSLGPISSARLTPDSMRAIVRRRKAEGADVIKIFASGSIRDGGQQTLSDAQLAAICGEAKAQGLRTMVHAHSVSSIKAAVNAGCNQIEHGVFADEETLKLMAEKGVYFDPQICLVFRNYLDNRAKYEGIGNYNEAGFAAMEKAIPLVDRDVQEGDQDAGAQRHLRHGRGGGRAWPKRRRAGVPRAGRRAVADRRHHVGHVTRRGGPSHERQDRIDRAGASGGSRRGRGRCHQGRHRAPASHVRHEGRKSLPERTAVGKERRN